MSPRLLTGLWRREISENLTETVTESLISGWDYLVTPVVTAEGSLLGVDLESRIWRSALIGLQSEGNSSFAFGWGCHRGSYAFVVDLDWVSGYDFGHQQQTKLWLATGNWDKWISAKNSLCFSPGLVLRIKGGHSSELNRWKAEPIVAILLDDSGAVEEITEEISRLKNKSATLNQLNPSFSILSFLAHCFCRGTVHLITSRVVPDSLTDYLRNFHVSINASVSPAVAWTSRMFDVPQQPLQPLGQNLSDSVYETFERDRIKYDLYEKAIRTVLENSRFNTQPGFLVVAGAGRGGLVDAALRAAGGVLGTGNFLTIAAVEKNPYAVATLKSKQRNLPTWKFVRVISGDMRSVEFQRELEAIAPDQLNPKVDILVTELLGSFGDNEASPECINGAKSLGIFSESISIPRQYQSWIAPISASPAWESVKKIGNCGSPKNPALHSLHVVAFNAAYLPVAPEPVFEFCHDSPSPINKDRTVQIKFQNSEIDCVIHGLAGWFDCELANGVGLSTKPGNHTPNMVSWFPAFLPFEEPIYWRAGISMSVQVKRIIRGNRLWYEWVVDDGPIHNHDGWAYSVDL